MALLWSSYDQEPFFYRVHSMFCLRCAAAVAVWYTSTNDSLDWVWVDRVVSFGRAIGAHKNYCLHKSMVIVRSDGYGAYARSREEQ